jgi:hypothetical protein
MYCDVSSTARSQPYRQMTSACQQQLALVLTGSLKVPVVWNQTHNSSLCWKVVSSGMRRCVVLWKSTALSKKYFAFIFRVKNKLSKKSAWNWVVSRATKLLTFIGLHGVIFKKTELLTIATVKTWNPTFLCCFHFVVCCKCYSHILVPDFRASCPTILPSILVAVRYTDLTNKG